MHDTTLMEGNYVFESQSSDYRTFDATFTANLKFNDEAAK